MRQQPCTIAVALLLATALLCTWLLLAVSAQQQKAASGDDDEEANSNMKLDPETVRDAIASLLRDGNINKDGDGDGSDGYAKAAQEYLDHVQSVLADVKSPSEMYIREQLADLDALDGLLRGLESAAAGTDRLSQPIVARLVWQLAKGPARALLLPVATGPAAAAPSTSSFAYAGSELAARLAGAASELRAFLATASAQLTDDLRRHAEALPATTAATQTTREYLDAVLDRVLALEGKKVKMQVQYPEEGSDGEPSVTRVEDQEDDEDQSSSSSSSSSSTSSDADADADGGGRRLFDQVLSRRAATSVAAALAASGKSAAAARIEELRQREYQPAGMAAILEAIEQCLED